MATSTASTAVGTVSQPPDGSGEFSVAGQPAYDRRGPVRWILSHLTRHPWLLTSFVVGSILAAIFNSMIPGYTGRAFDQVLGDTDDPRAALIEIAIALTLIVLARAAFDVIARYAIEFASKAFERDAREELFVSLLGKSQTFHNRQRVGDLMARATNDVRQLNFMVSPGVDLLFDTMTALIVPYFFIAFIDVQLLLVPGLFLIAFFIALRDYLRRLTPVSEQMREQFGILNAGLNEAVRGVEVIKATGQEAQERARFDRDARRNRDLAVRQGVVQAWYLPTLILAVATAGSLLHGLWLVRAGDLSVGGLIAYLGLVGQLGFPTNISIFSFSLIQMGIASANRILHLLRERTELDQNVGGYAGEVAGRIEFDHVTFSYGGEPVLVDVSFVAEPGQTVAIVGETGAGKSTLTKLVNRTYDVQSGRILVDGVDVRDWSLDALRSRISTIEQDITLFSRSVAENIGFSLGQQIDREAIVAAAKDAQAHGFIVELPKGYETIIGERGVTLSGGQRQRLAIARALLTSPRILILDDSTSAIDSATEDEIQRAIRRVLEGRTTLLITHRLSQIRWADKVLLIRQGHLIDQGTHDELLARCDLYRRIFAHYETKDSGLRTQDSVVSTARS